MRSSLKWCAIASIAIVLLSLVPQCCLWFSRGSQWNGAYATIDGDEFLYSAYLNALIDGRPRRNDPFSGRDDHPTSPLPESTFSIQFVPPFVIVGVAKLFRLSASGAFILLLGTSGLLASASLFWLLLNVTGDNRAAAIGTLVVLCLGGIAAGQGIVGVSLGLDVSSLGLPFLRRYQPAATFGLLFVFCTLVWRAFVAEVRRKALFYSGLAGLTIGVLIFSYLFLWIAAAAWLLCCCLLWLIFRPSERRRTLEIVLVLCGFVMLALVPYMYLLSLRSRTLDETQTLIATRSPDLFRVPEIVGCLVMIILVIAIQRGRLSKSNSSTIFAFSFAVLPIILFNQQVLTGKSMQPFHFEHFVANYLVLVSLVIAVMTSRHISTRASVGIAVLCIAWAFIEVYLPARVRSAWDVENDQMIPVFLKLNELSFQDGTRSGLQTKGQTQTMVFSPDIEVLRLLPTFTAQGVAVGLGGLDFGSASGEELKVFDYLYFCGIDSKRFRDLLQNRTSDIFLNYYARSAVFGHERVLPSLSMRHQPIRDDEIEEFVSRYEKYTAEFTRENALKHPITYMVVRRNASSDFSRVDRWYERELADPAGDYDLYQLRLRNNQ